MLIELQETDTAAVDGAIAACSGLSATSTTDNRTATRGGTAGTTARTITLANNTNNKRGVHFEMAALELDSYQTPSGNWVVRLNVTTASSNVLWESVYICRVNSSGVSQHTIGSATGQGVSLATTGVKSITVSGGADTASPGDRIYLVLGFSTTIGDSFAYKPDQLIDTPLTFPGSVQVLRRRYDRGALPVLVRARSKRSRVPFIVGTLPAGPRHHQSRPPLAPPFSVLRPGRPTKRHRVPFASVAAPPAGAFVRFRTRKPKAPPKTPPLGQIPGKAKRHRVPFASTASGSGGAFNRPTRRVARGGLRARMEPPRGKVKRRRVPWTSTAPTAAGSFVRFAHRLPRRQPGLIPEPPRARRRRVRLLRPDPVLPRMVVLRHHQGRAWYIGTQPLRGKVRRGRVPWVSTQQPPGGPFIRLAHRLTRGGRQLPEPLRGRSKRRRTLWVSVTPPAAGAFVRFGRRLARGGLGWRMEPLRGRAKRSKRPKTGPIPAPVILRHHQAQGPKRWRPEPERGRRRRGRILAPVAKPYPHRKPSRAIGIPEPPQRQGRSRRSRLINLQVSTPVGRRRRPTRILARQLLPRGRSPRRRPPVPAPVLPTVIRSRRGVAVRTMPPPARGRTRRGKKQTPGTATVSLAVIRRRRTALPRSLPTQRLRPGRRRSSGLVVFRVLRRRCSAATVRQRPAVPTPFRKRRLPGIAPATPRLARSRKRLAGALAMPQVGRGRTRRGKKQTPGTATVSLAVIRRRRTALPRSLPTQRLRPGRRRSSGLVVFRVLRRRCSAATVRQRPAVPIPFRKRRLPGIAPATPRLARARKRLAAALAMPQVGRGRTRRGKKFTPGTAVSPNPVIRRHRTGLMARARTEPTRPRPSRRRLPQVGPASAAMLLRRRRLVVRTARRTPKRRGGIVRHGVIGNVAQPVPLRTAARRDSNAWIRQPLPARGRSWRHGLLRAFTTPVVPPVQPDLVGTAAEARRLWVEPGHSRTHVEPQRSRTWVEPRRFVSRG